MGVKLRPMSDVGGAEVFGVDVKTPMSASELATVERAFVDHRVLVFREQPMSAPELVVFARQFGELQPHVQRAYQHPEAPEVVNMTNRKPDGSFDEAGARRGAIENLRDGWHSDLSYDPEPAKATLLHALDVTSSGGNTCFANVAMAFQALPENLKQRVVGRRVAFPYGGHARNQSAAKAASRLDSNAKELASATHPAVNVHPETREPAIYANPLLASRILDVSDEESEELLEALFDFINREEFRWEHEWGVGDTLMWDNRGGVMHCGRLDYPRHEARRFIRTTVRGGPTEAYVFGG
ncbi:MAG: Alpha-ketoglutarate-dependent taurine dioxygenase [Alphaproteobacteria bacterium MarineAlpha4_Bin2]|nr:MAG: Alpha-ketoglutarate-dependent taurine dioxygenase [Alphaproteobacteria bacterium MarineAlpha4_Bin2]